MKDIINSVLDHISVRGLDYGDVRIVTRSTESLSTRDGVVEAVESSQSLGLGVRVLFNGAWGFAATNDFSSESLKNTCQKALKIAKATARLLHKKTVLYPARPVKARYETKIEIDPFTVGLSKKIALLLATDKEMRKVKGIKTCQSFQKSWREEKIFASTEGAFIEQKITETGAGLECLATDGNEAQNRSYPNSFRGQFKTMGYELVNQLDLPGHARKTAEEAAALLKAPECPAGDFDLILDGNQLALQIHESCGHPTELDRVMGFEAAYAGTSFMTVENLGKLKYGSSIVNLTADSTTPAGLGTFGYDDEGVPAGKNYLVKNGLHVGYLTSRETLPMLIDLLTDEQKALVKDNLVLTGCMRADGWQNIPLVRMVNVSLEPGRWDFANLIKDTENGLFLSTNRSWSIDDRRINFQFGTEIAYEIKNGKLTGKIFKNPIYSGITPQFWNSCDAICNKNHWEIWGTPNCGKGEPSQLAHTGHGASPARFRKVKVGFKK